MIRAQKGFSMVQIMIGVGILGLSMYLYMGSTGHLNKYNKEVVTKLSVERQALNLFFNIKNNPGLYQTNYNAEEFFDITNKKALMEALPLAWNDKMFIDVEECKTTDPTDEDCAGYKGRMGYVLTPHPELRGLFKLTIRVTHADLFTDDPDPNKPGFRDYTFILNGQ